MRRKPFPLSILPAPLIYRSTAFHAPRSVSASLSVQRTLQTPPRATVPKAPSIPRRKHTLLSAFAQRYRSGRRSPASRRAIAVMLTIALLLSLPALAAADDTAGVLAIVNGQALPIAGAQAQFDDYAPFFVSFGQGDALDALRREIAHATVRRALILEDCRRLGIEADEHDRADLRAQADADYAAML